VAAFGVFFFFMPFLPFRADPPFSPWCVDAPSDGSSCRASFLISPGLDFFSQSFSPPMTSHTRGVSPFRLPLLPRRFFAQALRSSWIFFLRRFSDVFGMWRRSFWYVPPRAPAFLNSFFDATVEASREICRSPPRSLHFFFPGPFAFSSFFCCASQKDFPLPIGVFLFLSFILRRDGAVLTLF